MQDEANILEPLPYLIELRDYLKSNESQLWHWFASADSLGDPAQHLRTALLKSAYRLDSATHLDLHQAIEETRRKLGLEVPVTLYQAQNAPQPNATLLVVPGEAHLVFSGPLLSLLNNAELRAILAHELAHYQLWNWQNGELRVVDRLIHAAANDPRASANHEETARKFRLYTEIYCDRAALRVTADLQPSIASLVKLETGLKEVNAAAYLEQAAEIFARESASAEGKSHPETFIRARALSLWHTRGNDSDPEILRMIEGTNRLDNLDLLAQQRMTQLTRHLIEQLLAPRWFQTPAVMGHARIFFHDLQPAPDAARDSAVTLMPGAIDEKLREYWCYLLLDFATVDPNLDSLPLAAALEWARRLELDALFERIAARELKIKLRDVRKLKEHAAEMLARAEVNA